MTAKHHVYLLICGWNQGEGGTTVSLPFPFFIGKGVFYAPFDAGWRLFDAASFFVLHGLLDSDF